MNRLRVNHFKLDKDDENCDKRQTNTKSHQKYPTRKSTDNASGAPGSGPNGNRFYRTKKVNSTEYGMPIVACPASTKLTSRNAQNSAAPKSARWQERTAGSRSNGGKTGWNAKDGNNGPLEVPCSLQQTQARRSSPCTGACQVIGAADNLVHSINSQRATGGGLNAVATATVGGAAKRKKIKLAKAFLLPDQENKSFVYLCKPVKKVRELLTARRLKDSVEQLMSKDISSTTTLRQDNFSDIFASAKSMCSASEVYELAPLAEIETSSSNGNVSSARLCANMCELLVNHQHNMYGSELETLRDGLPLDQQQVDKDESLFRDILRTQLTELQKQQSVVKSALTALEQNKPMPELDSESASEVLVDTVDEDILKPEAPHSNRSSLASPTSQSIEKPFEKEDPLGNQNLSQMALNQLPARQQPAHHEHQLTWALPESSTAVVSMTTVATSALNLKEHTPTASASASAATERQLEYELVLKGIPSLQREIEMLQSIGEKMESTLRASTDFDSDIAQTVCDAATNTFGVHLDRRSSSIYYTPFEYMPDVPEIVCTLPKLKKSQSVPMIIRHVSHVYRPFYAKSESRTCGVLHCFGYITEFRIEQKTLTELKNADDNQYFYIPINDQNTELKRTSFRKLKANPNVLMQQLKPRKLESTFNLLEQDPMFFNSILAKNQNLFQSAISEIPEPSSSEHLMLLDDVQQLLPSSKAKPLSQEVERLLEVATGHKLNFSTNTSQTSNASQWTISTRQHYSQRKLSSRQGESRSIARQYLHKAFNPPATPVIPKSSMFGLNVVPRSKASLNVLEEPQTPPLDDARLTGGKTHHAKSTMESKPMSQKLPLLRASRVRRKVTPMRSDEPAVGPKSQLLKTVIVGIVQITVFLLLIMAFTYPDIRC